ncbi:MAG: helix-turn-helix domain-containing protein [Fluviicola sp.]
MDYTETAIKVGEKIKENRLKNNLTQMDLASLCNIERSNLSRIESGKSNVTLQTLVLISDALNIDIKELF